MSLLQGKHREILAAVEVGYGKSGSVSAYQLPTLYRTSNCMYRNLQWHRAVLPAFWLHRVGFYYRWTSRVCLRHMFYIITITFMLICIFFSTNKWRDGWMARIHIVNYCSTSSVPKQTWKALRPVSWIRNTEELIPYRCYRTVPRTLNIFGFCATYFSKRVKQNRKIFINRLLHRVRSASWPKRARSRVTGGHDGVRCGHGVSCPYWQWVWGGVCPLLREFLWNFQVKMQGFMHFYCANYLRPENKTGEVVIDASAGMEETLLSPISWHPDRMDTAVFFR